MPTNAIAVLLTPKGTHKLDSIMSTMREQVAISLFRETQRVRTIVAAVAPSEDEEAHLLSEGEVTGGDPFSGTRLGTPEDGRFIRDGAMVGMREAIATDPINITRTNFGNTITTSTGSPTRINPRTGFSWLTRRRGLQGPTFPFNNAYLQALEFGGLQWLVIPRGRYFLEPEPGVSAREMLKTLEPRHMYTRTIVAQRANVLAGVERDVREAVRRVGRA